MRSMKAQGRRGRSKRTVGCEEAREAISARIDEESPPIPGPVLEAHLNSCLSCRVFEARLATIGRQARLHAPKRAPDDLVAKLRPLLDPAPRAPWVLVHRWRPGAGPSRLSGARWAAAALPAALAVGALSSGVGSQPHLVPTRPPSPCTIGLSVRGMLPGSSARKA